MNDDKPTQISVALAAKEMTRTLRNLEAENRALKQCAEDVTAAMCLIAYAYSDVTMTDIECHPIESSGRIMISINERILNARTDHT